MFYLLAKKICNCNCDTVTYLISSTVCMYRDRWEARFDDATDCAVKLSSNRNGLKKINTLVTVRVCNTTNFERHDGGK
jgi:hypothetical protein